MKKSIFKHAQYLLIATISPFIFSHSAHAALSKSNCTNHDQKNKPSSSVLPYKKFKAVLDNTNGLQWPQSSNTCLSASEIKKGYVSSRFFLKDNRYLVFDFKASGSRSDRMELRGKTWKAKASSGIKKWEGNFKVRTGGSKQFAVAQLFGSYGGNNDDAAKISFYKSRKEGNKTRRNGLWLNYATSRTGKDIYKYLGAVSGFDKIKMTYNRKNGELKVYRDGNLKTKVKLKGYHDNNADLYFKAGCYLQQPGECRVEFSSLYFDD